MDTLYNNLIGPFIFFSLVTSIILAFVLPKTKQLKHLGIGQTYFTITNVCGIILGAIGIITIFLLEPGITKKYLWKILIMPYVYMQIYIIYVMIAKKTINIFDEKQDFNMTSGAALSFGAMIIIMGLIISPLLQNRIMESDLLFPLFINFSIFVYSISTLFLFKKA